MKVLIRSSMLFVIFCLSHVQADALELTPVADKVWAIIGPLTNRSAENLGNNATFGFVITEQGVVLIDSGGSYLGAQKIHQKIQSVTDKPVKFVINTGGQDHRWFGNEYFNSLGAVIISSRKAREDQEKRVGNQISGMMTLIGDDNFSGTKEKYADRLFDETMKLTLGGVNFEIVHAGQAHTPGDAFVWLADRSVMFSGDIVYVERILGVGEQSSSKSWVQAFEAMAAYKPRHVVPGHGRPVSLDRAQQDTYQYLTQLRQKVARFIDKDGDASDISQVDMSAFSYLINYDTLSGRNALKVYTELEWE